MANTAQNLPFEKQIVNPKSTFTRYEVFVVGVLAFLQFTVILDFMILSPLGAILMPKLKISPTQFGFVVSIYAFSAGLSGILAAGFADEFDRKKFLLVFYVGFMLGTLFCALAPSYEYLVAARMVTGLFGGVLGSIVFAITTDLFAYEVRGRVMGFVQTAFAASQILGIPCGLYLATHWGWHVPFLMIVFVSGGVGLLIWRYLRPIDAHIDKAKHQKPFQHLWQTLTTPFYLQSFATTALLSTGGFMLMPFGSAFSVHNLGLTLAQLPSVYLVTGLCTMVMGPLIGRLSDAVGKFNMFMFGSALSIVMVSIYTRLEVTPIMTVMLINSILFVGIFSRMIPSQALMSAVPAPKSRGAFMAISSSLQQISGGFAAIIAGFVVHEAADGRLERFDVLGSLVILSTLITVVLMYFIHRKIRKSNKQSI